MPNLNAILKRKGTAGVDKYLREIYYGNLELNMSGKACYKFVSNYLNNSFVYNDKSSFAIIKFIARVQYCLPLNFLNNIANTTYFETMPKKYTALAISIALDCLRYNISYGFSFDLIHRLDKEDIKEFITHRPMSSTILKILAHKIVSFHDIDFIIDINPNIDKAIDSDFYDYVPQNFSFEDTKKFLIYYTANYNYPIDTLEDTKESKTISKETKLDAYLDIVYDKITCYKYNLEEITIAFIKDLDRHKFTSDDYNYLASKILTRNNDDIALVWVCNTTCSNNLAIIDKLITNNIKKLSIILEADNDEYLNYIVNKIPEDKINEFFLNLKELANTNINIIDKALDIILNKYPNYKLITNPLVFLLVKNGSRYTPTILQEKEFTKEERINIYNSWLDLELELYLISFGSYLLNGSKNYLPTNEDFLSNKGMLLELKKGN